MKETTDKNLEINNLLQRLGPVIRTAMIGAIALIQRETATFVAVAKVSYGGETNDIVTTMDTAAQAFYVERFTRELPGIGLVGEEDGLKLPCTIEGEDIYITIDPIDGTKAFARLQSHGVGTMVGVVRNGEIIAAYVGDTNTGEIYGYAPDAPCPTRVRFGVETVLDPKPETPLGKRYILLNAAPMRFPEKIQKLILRPNEGGLFKDVEVGYGSYGIFCARLWKGEVAAAVFDPAYTTPWDEVPVLGIMNALGFVRVGVDPEGKCLGVYDQAPPTEVEKLPFNIITVHKAHLDEVLRALA